jgi:hypothetical protein
VIRVIFDEGEELIGIVLKARTYRGRECIESVLRFEDSLKCGVIILNVRYV